MTLQEYVENNGYKVSDLTQGELKEVAQELKDIEGGMVIMDGFFSPMSKFSQRMLQK